MTDDVAMDGMGLRDRLRAAAAWLDASPAEVAGLLVLLAGSLAIGGLVWWRALPGTPPTAEPAPGPAPTVTALAPEGADTLTVHVAGAVVAPGLVTIPVGARVADAMSAAGGPSAVADLDRLNLARPVADGEQLIVPRLGASGTTAPDQDSGGAADGAIRPDGRLDLNRATATELEQLPGVGPVIAGRIVAWRDEQGPFTEPGQLRQVPGIGERTFQRLADLVAV